MSDSLIKDRFGDWIGEGWRMFVDQWQAWVINMLAFFGVMLIPLGAFGAAAYVIMIGAVVATSGARADPPPEIFLGFFGIYFIVLLLLVLLSAFVSAGLYKSAFKQLRGGQVKVSDLFSGGDRFLPLVGAMILISLLTIVGLMACILPGLLVGALFFFTPHLIIDQGLGPIEAMKRSYEMTRKHIWWFLLFAFLVNLIAQIGSYVCYVGLLASYPLHFTIGVIAYRDCFAIPNARIFPGNTAPAPGAYSAGPVGPTPAGGFCRYCNAPLSPSSMFCPGCGQQVS